MFKGTYWSFSEICAVSKVSKTDIGRVFKLILKVLETNVEIITTGDFMVSAVEGNFCHESIVTLSM